MFDGGGLYIEVAPNCAKYWRLKYRHAGKEKRLALGVFPEVSLTEAREGHDAAHAQLRKDIDPGAERKATALAARDAVANSFEAITREWLHKRSKELEEETHRKVTSLFEKWAFPWIGSRPISEITLRELLESVLRRVEANGKLETVHRLKQRCGQVFRYAIPTGHAERDPTPDLCGALSTYKTRNLPAITDPAKIGELLHAIDGYQGSLVMRCALR